MSQLIKRITKKGFTLIELMIVVAIIGILAAIAIPKFADLITKSKESAIKGSLGSVRGALTIYYSDTEGVWPATGSFVTAMTTSSKYLDAMPTITIPKNDVGNSGHPAVATVADTIGDVGNWAYAVAGQIQVNCSHKDTKGSTWSLW